MLKRILPFVIALLLGIAAVSFAFRSSDPKNEEVFSAKELNDSSSCTLETKLLTRKAIVKYKPEPHYTEEATQNGTIGKVQLRMVFAASGEVENINVLQGLPDGLNDQAIHAAQQIEFEPALKDGQPVSQYVTINYSFTLY